eukprot:COSAG04_NODE_11349_length_715_cov_0.748377_1_plen_134_part_10
MRCRSRRAHCTACTLRNSLSSSAYAPLHRAAAVDVLDDVLVALDQGGAEAVEVRDPREHRHVLVVLAVRLLAAPEHALDHHVLRAVEHDERVRRPNLRLAQVRLRDVAREAVQDHRAADGGVVRVNGVQQHLRD